MEILMARVTEPPKKEVPDPEPPPQPVKEPPEEDRNRPNAPVDEPNPVVPKRV
jgi:hypothetical protein